MSVENTRQLHPTWEKAFNGGDYQAAAQAFLAFITGTAGQDVLRTGTSFEYAVGSAVASNPALPALDTLQSPTVDPSTLNSTEVIDMMTSAGLL